MVFLVATFQSTSSILRMCHLSPFVLQYSPRNRQITDLLDLQTFNLEMSSIANILVGCAFTPCDQTRLGPDSKYDSRYQGHKIPHSTDLQYCTISGRMMPEGLGQSTSFLLICPAPILLTSPIYVVPTPYNLKRDTISSCSSD